jgi:Amt family ammonium transporter
MWFPWPDAGSCTNGDVSFSGQLIGAATIFGWVFVTSFVTWFILKMIMGIRVSEEEEYEGVDIGECGLEAYFCLSKRDNDSSLYP